ncbi:MAG: putative basic amino acid antiporter YfcC [Acidobacteriota bacterium]|nr:MAG: putative basic amino acid antiporter YfcC [Acidobacteriota bacterium]
MAETAEENTVVSRFKSPDTALIVFAIIVFAAVMTWIIPAGAYERSEMDVQGVGKREVVIPGTYQVVELEHKGFIPSLLHSAGMILKAPILGITDKDVVQVIAFVFLVGGAFSILQQTGAVDAGLRRLVQASRRSKSLSFLMVPLFMAIFSLGGAVFGMSEEIVPFVLIFVPLALALGYDSITGAAIPIIGSMAGFAAAFFNPFTVGVAQGIAGVPLFSGAGFRVVLWAVITAIAIAFVMWYGHRVLKDPERSRMFEADQRRRSEGLHLDNDDTTFTGRQKTVLAIFFVGLALLVWGVLPPEQGGQGWYIVEISALFIGVGLLMGIVGGLGANGTATAFSEGVRQLAVTGVIIGLARGILVVLQDGQVIDTVLYAMATVLEGTTSATAAMVMFAGQTFINFFVPSGSGQAALTMPLMAPLSDLVGVTRQTAVLAFQMGDGFTNMIIPTSPVLMGSLALANIPWTNWARWVLPLQLLLFVVGLIVLSVAVSIGFGS